MSEIYAKGIFVTFPWYLKNVKSRSKIALFSNERHFEIWFPTKKTITFFWSKLSKLHKKDQILHVATSFSLKQGETRTSHGPIPHPLTMLTGNCITLSPWIWWFITYFHHKVMFLWRPSAFCPLVKSICMFVLSDLSHKSQHTMHHVSRINVVILARGTITHLHMWLTKWWLLLS